MYVLLYTSLKDALAKELKEVVEAEVMYCGHGTRLEVCDTIDGVAHRLRKSKGNLALCVLLAATRKELAELQRIGESLFNVRLILILPDSDADTLAKGHSLRPRYMTYRDHNFGEVGAVMRKMLKNLAQMKCEEGGVKESREADPSIQCECRGSI
jgi:hypothetical protein